MKTEYKILLTKSSLEILEIKNLQHHFPMHFHKRMCIGRIDDGSKILIIDGKIIRLTKDDLFFIPPYKPHTTYVENDCKADYTIICANSIDKLYEGIILENKINNSKNSILASYINKLCNIPHNPLFMNERINVVLSYIENNYMENLTINLLSEIACLSPFHLLHIFKKNVGISLHQFIIQTRIKKFKEKAIFQEDILDLALSCGFYDQSHLIKTFKKHVGTTPQKYIHSINIID